MVSISINIQESDLVLFGRAKQIDITICSDQEDPQEAVKEAFDTLDLVLERKVALTR